jgi:nucleoside 2-deoxyribosyltransferase
MSHLIVSDRYQFYFAAPLFSQAELAFNEQIVEQLEQYVDIYLPQRDGGKVVDLVNHGVSPQDAYRTIFDRDLEALEQSQGLILVLDGRSIDEGACFELGVAYASKKMCIGLQTDTRRLLPLGNNPMVECALSHRFDNAHDLKTWVAQFAATTAHVR